MIYHGRPAFGCAIETTVGKLNCKHLIHTVGPMYMRHDPVKSRDHYIDVSSECLQKCIISVLDKAHNLDDVESISIPTISCGIYGFPKETCAEIILTTCTDWI